MNIVEVAKLLDGKEYREEVGEDLRKELKDSGILVIYGASDDIMCLDGAIYDESYDTIYLLDGKLLVNECEEDDCPYHKRNIKHAWFISPIWHDSGDPCWTYETNLPHTTFNIMEDGEVYCRGIVIDLQETNSVSA